MSNPTQLPKKKSKAGEEYLLVVQRGPNPEMKYTINKDTVTIGRDEANDISIDDIEISRFHARIIRTDGGYSLIDLDSMNGTYISGEQLRKSAMLVDGDRIGVGESVVLSFEKKLPNKL